MQRRMRSLSRYRRKPKYQSGLKYRSYTRRRRKELWFLLLLIVGGLIWLSVRDEKFINAVRNLFTSEKTDEALVYEDIEITQAYAMKILSYSLQAEVPKDTEGLWYEKYYTALEEKNIKLFQVEDATNLLEVGDLQPLFATVLGEEFHITLQGGDEHKTLKVGEFLKVYASVLAQADQTPKWKEKEMGILATPADDTTLKAWEVVTTVGNYGFEGLILDPLKGESVKAIVIGGEILAITSISQNSLNLKDCYIEEVDEGYITFSIEELSLTYPQQGLAKVLEGSTLDLIIERGVVVAAGVQDMQIDNKVETVIRVTDTSIEFSRAGKLSYNKNLILKDARKNGNYTDVKQIPCGTVVELEREGDLLTDLKIIGIADSSTIRVLLSNNLQNIQEEVHLISTDVYSVEYNGNKSELPAETSWKATNFEWIETDDTIRFIPQEQESQIKIYSMSKRGNSPKYKGIIEIRKVENGYVVVNELNMEDYVAAVIPSEMPTSYGLEALKVQAVAARTYAVTSQKSIKYISYGAQIDDTTASQVYNNTPADDLSYAAAEETAGKIIVSPEGSSFSSKFFATSCGYTANYGEVWAGENFPGNTPIYLASNKQYIGDALVEDMSKEEDAYAFLTLSPEEVEAYDSDSPWFRWTTNLEVDELTALINSALQKISQSYPSLVKAKASEGWVEGGLENIGNVYNLSVAERGSGGNIMKLVITGERGTVEVSTEYLIRSLFSSVPDQTLTIERADGTTVNNMSLLPSAFFVMDINYNDNNRLTDITLHGGGFGHGVGMSQDGVRGMAEKGMNYEEILEHFYSGIDIVACNN